MVWRIEFDRDALRDLDRLDAQAAKRILAFLHGRVAKLDNPRMIGQPLKGSKLGEFWKYRVGDFRIICFLDDGAVCVLVVKIGNRREVYR